MTASPYKKFIKDVILVGIVDSFKSLRALIIIPILTKTLGAGGYGMWIQIRVAIMFFVPIVVLGLDRAIVCFLAGKHKTEEISDAFFSSLAVTLSLGLVCAGIIYAFSDYLSVFILGTGDFSYFVKLAALLLLLICLDHMTLIYFQTFRQMKNHFIFLSLESLGEVLLVAFMVFNGFGILGVLFSLIVIKMAFFIFKFLEIISQIGLKMPTFLEIKKYIRYGYPLAIAYLFYFLINYSDRYIINYFSGVEKVGIYSVAYAVGSIIIIIMTSIIYVLHPALADCLNNKKLDEAKRYVQYFFKFSLMFMIPIALVMSVAAKKLILLFSTSEFLAAQYCVPFIATGFVIFGIGIVGEYIIILKERTSLISWLYVILAFFNIIGNIILVPRFGIIGAAAATFLTFIGYAVFTISLSRRYLAFSLDYLFVFKSIMVSSCVLLLILKLAPLTVLGMILFIMGGIALYFICLYVLKGINKKEIAFFKDLVFRGARSQS
ncbi:oligosaccharide flippase family protein [Candidatus Omnitrophota bacterium]